MPRLDGEVFLFWYGHLTAPIVNDRRRPWSKGHAERPEYVKFGVAIHVPAAFGQCPGANFT